jgi:valyl-tRNA synthetase
MPIDKTFDHAAIEQALYARWESSGAFKVGRRPDAKPFTIMMPPPNVTGSLHIGHALNHTLQDVLARFERMRGRDVLWQPGTDHAGIATQLVVERQLAEQQTSRQKLGRDEFLKRVWEWKKISGDTITTQLRRLGVTCDWSRERFTMDRDETGQMSRAVLKTFVKLYKEGLIYKDTRLVNWDPRLQTSVSDLEVENIEIDGHLWHITYPVDGAPETITVATTRPETMLGDTAVAVHPNDERYKHLVGKMVRLPLTGRLIPIIADEYSDPEKGSGAVKITPAHDFNDYEVGRRHGLDAIAILDKSGKICAPAPAVYLGLDRFDARKRIVADLDGIGLLEKVEKIRHAVPHDEKTKTVVIEPFLTEQWYLNAAVLARPAMEAVRSGQTRFVPDNWEKTYFRWMENIQPWCISRQLWWGHQIPAWYGPDSQVFVEETETEAIAAAGKHYGKPVALTRDPDVLDTWFSSGLWPFSTLGWPDDTPELKRYYPGDVLVTMFDIIFFWVARMMMFGVDNRGAAPFHTVLIHARVVEEKGQKMSKTRGNVVDPLTLIDQFGTDAVRFTLAMAAAPNKDVRMGPGRVEPLRNFGTKIWNAARFCEMNQCQRVAGFDPARVAQPVNRWIVAEAAQAQLRITQALESFRFNEAAGAAYEFTWNVFCDWYLEFIKPVLNEGAEAAKAETRATAAWTLDQILTLLHPFMPYITEELWRVTGEVGPKRESMLIEAAWPDPSRLKADSGAAGEMGWVQRLISEVRSVRTEMNVPAAAKLDLTLRTRQGLEEAQWLDRHRDLILRMARLESAGIADAIPKGFVQIVAGDTVAGLDLGGVIDFDKERARLKKEIDKAVAEIAKIDAKLNNPNFVSRAAEDVVEEQRDRREETEALARKLNEALARLG